MNPLLTDQLIPLALAVGVALCLDVAYWRWKKKRAQTQKSAGLTDWLAAWTEAGGSGLDRLWASLTSGWRAVSGRRIFLNELQQIIEHYHTDFHHKNTVMFPRLSDH